MDKKNPILGSGKYKVSACKGEKNGFGKFYALAITPYEGEPRKVGEPLTDDEKIKFIDNSTDIAIYFTNTESVDVVIDNLKKVKKFLQEDQNV